MTTPLGAARRGRYIECNALRVFIYMRAFVYYRGGSVKRKVPAMVLGVEPCLIDQVE